MKDKRPGEELWLEWDGEGYFSTKDNSIFYYTFGIVDMDNEIVRRALASALQRDGVVVSLGEGFKVLEKSVTNYTYCGLLDEELSYIVCSQNGETKYGDFVEKPMETTFIEI